MWITRQRYEDLVRAEAAGDALQTRLSDALRLLDLERDRADRATDAALLARGLMPIAPTKPPTPEVGLFDEDPEELTAMLRRLKTNPTDTLLSAGVGVTPNA